MPINKSTQQGYLGNILNRRGIFDMYEISPEIQYFYNLEENIDTDNFRLNVPIEARSGDTLLYLAACRDGRSQQSFTDGPGGSWINLATGFDNLFARYRTAVDADAGASVGGNWSSNTDGPAVCFVIDGNYADHEVQNRTSSSFTLNSLTINTPSNLGILFYQSRNNLPSASPGLGTILETGNIVSSSYYQIELGFNTTYPLQNITNSNSDCVGAYVSFDK